MSAADTDSEKARRALELELFGQRLTVVSDSNPDVVRDVVEFVNRRMETIREGAPRAGTDQIALLAALNIAEELFEERRKSAALKRRVQKRSRELLSAIDAVSRQVDGMPMEGADAPN